MKKTKYLFIISFIFVTIALIIGIQVYWNIKNFENSKLNITKNIQASLDNTVEEYFVERSKKTIEAFLKDSKFKLSPGIRIDKVEFRSSEKYNFNPTDTINIKRKNISKKAFKITKKQTKPDFENYGIESNNKKIFLELSEKIKKNIIKSNATANGTIIYTEYNIPITEVQLSKTKLQKTKNSINFTCQSKQIGQHEKIELKNININQLALGENLIGIILSLLLSIIMIFCLAFLLRTINKQKQIDEIKNDFISNITHELKTPIAVITSAIEGVQHFNEEKDQEKTNKYLKISENQLVRLNNLVEKILETATLDSSKLKLNKQNTNLNVLIEKSINLEKTNTSKTIKFKAKNTEILAKVDTFHFENVLNNLIQNAIKYGGNEIEISLNQNKKVTEIEVLDSGKCFDKTHHKKVFEKFYRIPTKNIHNVKGFGIGLFYVKQIVLAHLGDVEILPTKTTHFKITLPND